jgi:hypothetical protein
MSAGLTPPIRDACEHNRINANANENGDSNANADAIVVTASADVLMAVVHDSADDDENDDKIDNDYRNNNIAPSSLSIVAVDCYINY